MLDSLFQLVDRRYSAMRPTLVTTQYRPSDLVRRLAEQGDADTAKAIVSRLRHGARVVEFDGPDGRARMMLDASQLRGWPKERAELYGQAAPGRPLHGEALLRAASAALLRVRQAGDQLPPRCAQGLGA